LSKLIEVFYTAGPNVPHLTEPRYIAEAGGAVFIDPNGERPAWTPHHLPVPGKPGHYSTSPRGASILAVRCAVEEPTPTSALDVQVGGNHYKGMKIQPVEFIVENAIPYREANVIKYVCRHRAKNGLQDLKKAAHYLQMLIEEAEKE